VRKTFALVQVALALMADAGSRHWGYELSRQSGVRSGVMYPILQRMLNEGWLADGWEDQVRVGKAKRPPRRYYKLTDAGRVALGAVIAEARRDTRFAPLLSRQTISGPAWQIMSGPA
jgi:PadR family transcriptional regulator, regulatory protein PadR